MLRVSASRLLLLSVALISAVSLSAAQTPATQSHQPVEEGYVTTADGVRIYYQKAGRGSRTILIPARLFVFDDFRWLSETYTLIAYDMRNRGRSDFVAEDEKISIEKDVEDLETIRKHFGVEKFSTIGYSYLGVMVVLYALDHPAHVERIIQLGPVPLKFGTQYGSPWNQEMPDPRDPQARERLRKLREETFHLRYPRKYCEEEWKVNRVLLVGDPGKAGQLRSVCEMPNEWPTNFVRHLELHFAKSVQHLNVPRERVAQLTVPVLTIHGTQDRNAPYAGGREWVFLLPNARLLSVSGAAHQVFVDAPDVVFSAVRTFLEGSWPARAEKVTQDPRAQQVPPAD